MPSLEKYLSNFNDLVGAYSEELSKRLHENRLDKMAEKKRPLYQLYEPQLKHIVTIKLSIGGSENIKKSISKYSVNVAIPKYSIEGKDGRETSSKLASQLPRWNEDLTIHIAKSETEVSKYGLEFSLKMLEPGQDPVTYTEKFTLGEIVGINTVIFDPDNKKMTVYVTNIQLDFQPDVRIRNQFKLCEDEEDFYTERRKKVRVNLNGVYGNVDVVPNIAVIGSGGGMRAVVGMCGAMAQLKEMNILDYVMYIAGVSGSSWYISTLYTEDENEIKPFEVRNSIRQRLENVQKSTEEMKKSLANAFQSEITHGNNTLTNVFGNLVGGILLEEKKDKKWSEQRTKLKTAGVPLPLLAAIQVDENKNLEEFNEWMELSPYEAFLPKYGTGIDMKHYGSEFDGGIVIKKHEEKPVHFLQGICGSAYGILMSLNKQETEAEKPSFWSFEGMVTALIKMFKTIGIAKVPNWLWGNNDPKQLFIEEDGLASSMKEVMEIRNPKMMLTDAGLKFNSPFPLVLHPARKVDLILSFDFSDNTRDADWPFGELKKAEAWANLRNIPFPIINKDASNHNEMYLFEGENCPTVMHFVMNHTDKSKESNQNLYVKYNVFKFHYSKDEFDWLSNVMRDIVEKNKEKINTQIEKAIKNSGFASNSSESTFE